MTPLYRSDPDARAEAKARHAAAAEPSLQWIAVLSWAGVAALALWLAYDIGLAIGRTGVCP